MKKIILTCSSLFAISLAGCSSTPHQNDTDVSTQNGDDNPQSLAQNEANPVNDGKIDWLTAWWKSVAEPIHLGVKGLGFNRWFTTAPPAEALDDDDAEESTINLWDTVGNRVTLGSNHPRIQKEANLYAKQRFLDQLSERAEPYFNFILGEVQRRNMPVELALLPAVESAYEPRATSSRRAAGLWQLIPGTARRWGLELNQNYDGRRDVFASTHAALDYLQKLNDDFEGDWLLTMAAYNCGELNVTRAIRKNLALGKATDFWSLDLPGETRSFVPRILGLAAVIAEPQNYGVQLKTLRDRPVVPIKIDYQIDLARVAQIVDIPLHEVQRLNPAYRQGKINLAGGNLLLPAPQAKIFEERLAALDSQQLSPFPTASDAPPIEASVTHALTESSGLSATTNGLAVQIHVVRRGDTLGSLARAAGVGVKDIISWNHLRPRMPLHPGQRLTLRQGSTTVALENGNAQTANIDKHVDKHGRVKAVILARSKHHSEYSPTNQRHASVKVTHKKINHKSHSKHS